MGRVFSALAFYASVLFEGTANVPPECIDSAPGVSDVSIIHWRLNTGLHLRGISRVEPCNVIIGVDVNSSNCSTIPAKSIVPIVQFASTFEIAKAPLRSDVA